MSGAVNSYKASGNSNNWVIPDVTDPAFLETLVDGDLSKSWGLVKIPVCSVADMVGGLLADPGNGAKNVKIPCPAQPGQGENA